MEDLHVYLRSITPGERTSLSVLASLVHNQATVLDLGCGSGALGQHLSETRGCTLDGVTYYNDSIASSPTRTIAGLRSFDQKIILIAGGYDKKIPYEPLAPEVLAHVKTLVLMGATGPRIEKAVRECDGFAGSGLTILHADSMQHAVELARGAAKPGDVVSLSPASASFDLYPNFEVRGRDYKNIVKNLK